MKLIYIANARIPTEKAHGYQISKMCEEFSSAGAQVELWLPTRKNQIQEDLFQFYGLKSNFKVVKVEIFDFVSLKIIGRLGFWLQSLAFLWSLSLKKFDKDALIYSRHPEIIWLFGIKGYKTVLEAHKWYGRKAWLAVYLVGRADKIVVLTKGLKNLFLKKRFLDSQIIVAPDSVDLKKFDLDLTKDESRSELGLPLDKIILLYTGSFKTMGQEKGVANILTALPGLIKDYDNLLFVAVGGNQSDIVYYRRLAQKQGVDSYIQLLPRVNLDKLARYQKAADVLLMPFPMSEHYAFYMSPLKMFEYMASHRPVVASDLPAIREVLHKNNAILIKPDSPEELANGISEIIRNKALAQRIALNAYNDVQQYTWAKRAKKILTHLSSG